MRAGVYVRISKDFAGEERGVARQREDCTRLAESLGWDVVEVFTDNDVSASKARLRPAYTRMLDAVRAGQLDAIVAWHPDRMYRRVVDLGELVDVCKAHQTQIATVNAGHIDLTTATGRLVAGLLAQVATYEVEHKADRWARSWRQGRELGAPARTGSRLFGYTRDSVVIPAEAEVTRWMAGEFLAGTSLQSIARRLGEQGVVGTKGGPWRSTSVRMYLSNPRIAGLSTWKGDVVADGGWEPLIDRDTWTTINAALKGRSRPAAVRVSLLNGLVFCACGQRMITGKSRTARLYRCPKRPGLDGCGRVSTIAAALEEVVEGYAEERLADPQVRAALATANTDPGRTHADLAEIQQRIGELEAQLEQPGVPVATLLRAVGRAQDRQEQLLADLAALPRVPVPQRGTPWPDDLERRRALVDLVVARVDLAPADKATGRFFDKDRVKVHPWQLV